MSEIEITNTSIADKTNQSISIIQTELTNTNVMIEPEFGDLDDDLSPIRIKSNERLDISTNMKAGPVDTTHTNSNSFNNSKSRIVS